MALYNTPPVLKAPGFHGPARRGTRAAHCRKAAASPRCKPGTQSPTAIVVTAAMGCRLPPQRPKDCNYRLGATIDTLTDTHLLGKIQKGSKRVFACQTLIRTTAATDPDSFSRFTSQTLVHRVSTAIKYGNEATDESVKPQLQTYKRMLSTAAQDQLSRVRNTSLLTDGYRRLAE